MEKHVVPSFRGMCASKFDKIWGLYFKSYSIDDKTSQNIWFCIDNYKIKIKLNVNLDTFIEFISNNIKLKVEGIQQPFVTIEIDKIIHGNTFQYNIESVNGDKILRCRTRFVIDVSPKYLKLPAIDLIIKDGTKQKRQLNLKYLFETCENTYFSGDIIVDDKDWKPTKNLKTMVEITRRKNNENNFFHKIASTLTELKLYDTNDSQLDFLTLPNLTKLSLQSTDASVKELESFLNNNTNVCQLSLSEFYFRSGRLSNILINNTTITDLHIDNCENSELYTILSKNKTIKYLRNGRLYKLFTRKDGCKFTGINKNFVSLFSPGFKPTVQNIISLIIPSRLIYIKIECKKITDEDAQMLLDKYPNNLLIVQILSDACNEITREISKRKLKANRTLQYILDKNISVEYYFTDTKFNY